MLSRFAPNNILLDEFETLPLSHIYCKYFLIIKSS